MANENENIPVGSENHEAPKHESWFKHVVDEIKEEIAELTEEAQQLDPNSFPMLGDGEVHHVHNHRHDHDNDNKEEEKK